METIYTAQANGFTGKGKTPREAEIALDYAAAFLPLAHEEGAGDGVAVYGNLPGWDGNEESCHAALVGKPAVPVA
jgi:hypothetical protein